ncbi:hypothetical protein KHA94_13575 [Bacillus sp. FJAT-49705]|uniref:Uncharacterized protein n=1 Tax=Cytobacillus citreus TaxID=2833586 RepID=A0ABS5NUY3_9BACI|nr:hypothetical protein [Cytobacillus citreus]MBS4191213.1 hypothetical protein [Cytobacillus citreus]
MAALYGQMNLVVESNKVICDEWLVPNQELLINHVILKEQDIFINQIADNTFNVSVAVSYQPNSDDEEEAFEEASRLFTGTDLNTYCLEDINHNLTSVIVNECRFDWQELM